MIYEDLKVAIFHVELCVFDGRHIISITRMQEKPDRKVMVDTTMMSIQACNRNTDTYTHCTFYSTYLYYLQVVHSTTVRT